MRVPIAQVLGRRAEDVLPDDTADAVGHHDREVLAGNAAVSWEQTYPVGAESRHFLVTKAPFRDADGDTAGIITLAQDISDRKRIEVMLQESLHELAEHNRDPGLRLRRLARPAGNRCARSGSLPTPSSIVKRRRCRRARSTESGEYSVPRNACRG